MASTSTPSARSVSDGGLASSAREAEEEVGVVIDHNDRTIHGTSGEPEVRSGLGCSTGYLSASSTSQQ